MTRSLFGLLDQRQLLTFNYHWHPIKGEKPADFLGKSFKGIPRWNLVLRCTQLLKSMLLFQIYKNGGRAKLGPGVQD